MILFLSFMRIFFSVTEVEPVSEIEVFSSPPWRSEGHGGG